MSAPGRMTVVLPLICNVLSLISDINLSFPLSYI